MKEHTEKPMLGCNKEIPFNEVVLPVYASYKIDGVRMLVRNQVPMSRTYIPLRNQVIIDTFSKPEYEGLDGEIVFGAANTDGTFLATTGKARKKTTTGEPTFYVFDVIDCPDLPFESRMEVVKERCKGLPNVVVLEQRLVTTEADLKAFVIEAVEAGYEGAITRSPKGPYKFGRSTALEQYLLKFKKFVVREAYITGFVEQMTNTNEAGKDAFGRTKRSKKKDGMIPAGTLGTLDVVDTETGVAFQLAASIPADLKQEIWDNQEDYLHDVVQYRMLDHGIKDKPRNTSIKVILHGIRPKFDVDNQN